MLIFIFHQLSCAVVANVIIGTLCRDGIILAMDNLPDNQGLIRSTRWTSHAKLITDQVVIACPTITNSDFHGFYDELKLQIKKIEIKSVEMISATARHCAYNKFPSVHVIIAGPSESGYKIFEILPGGSLITTKDYVITGEGSIDVSASLDQIHHGDKNNPLVPQIIQTFPIICNLIGSTTRGFHEKKQKFSIWVMRGRRWRKLLA
jgi:20S proteasome alpha/beta subunit